MNQSGIIQAEQIFYPGWLMVSQLRSGQEVQDGKALYRKARQLVTQARDKLAEAGFSQANIDTMLYAFCALLDESVLNRGKADDGWRTWQQDPLQAHFFGRLDAGEELWERIREQLKAPVADPVVLMCLYRTLQLGFTGQYRSQDDERREDVVRALGERVPPFALSQDAPVVVRAAGRRTGRRMYWLSWGTGIVALAVVWFVLSSLLAGQVPGGRLHTDLLALLHVYLGSRLDVRMQLCVDRALLPDAQICCRTTPDSPQLGRTAILKPLTAGASQPPRPIIISLGRYQRVQENHQRKETHEDGDYRW